LRTKRVRTDRQTDRQTDRHTPMTTRPCGLRRAGKNPFKKILHPDPESDDFQNLMVSSLSKHTSLVKFS